MMLHATAGTTFAGAFSTLKLKGYSYHDLIKDEDEGDDIVVRCVPVERIAFHAGRSVGPDGPSCNRYSLGLCYVNANDGRDPISERQIMASIERIRQYRAKYPSLKWLLTHYAATVQPDGSYRKSDPRGINVRQIAAETGLIAWKPGYARRFAL